MINYIDHTVDFWEIYGDYKYVEPFKSLYNNDITKDHKHSSQVMWFVTMCYGKSSKFKNLPEVGTENNKFMIVSEIVFGKSKTFESIENLTELKEAFIKFNYTAIERNLLMWDQLLDNRTNFLKSQSYDLSNFDELDKMAANTTKVVDAIKKLKDELAKEEGSGSGRGGAETSLND